MKSNPDHDKMPSAPGEPIQAAKKPYACPELIKYGDVQELTRGGRAVNPSDVASSLDSENALGKK